MQNGWYLDTDVFVVGLTHGRYNKGVVLLITGKYSEKMATIG